MTISNGCRGDSTKPWGHRHGRFFPLYWIYPQVLSVHRHADARSCVHFIVARHIPMCRIHEVLWRWTAYHIVYTQPYFPPNPKTSVSHCTCAETTIYKLPVKFLTPVFDCAPLFPYKVWNFNDLGMFSLTFCILHAESLPYFNFRFVWPTDLESLSHALICTLIINIKFEADMTVYCRVTAFFLQIRYITSWPWPLTFWSWTVVIHDPSTKFEDPTVIQSWV